MSYVSLHRIYSYNLSSKILRGFANYEQNTGSKHPSALNELRKRGTGDPLTDANSELWYGGISVGTPAVSFTSVFFLHS